MCRFGFLLLALVAACDEPPGIPGAPCAADRDCEGIRACVSGACVAPEDPRVPVDAGLPSLLGDPDLGHSDSGAPPTNPDLGLIPGMGLDAASPDLDGAPDLSSPDLGTPDLGRPDAGSPDARLPDVGSTAVPAVAAGRYQYRRINLRALAGEGLWRVAVSPDDRSLAASAFYERVYVLDRATETVRRTVSLPKSGADRLRITDLGYLGNGDLLVVATAERGTQPTGRLYRFDPNGTAAPALVGTARGISLERVVLRGNAADLVGSESLGGGRHIMGLFLFDGTKNTLTRVASRSVNAGCEGLATATDGTGGTARVYTCGVGGGDIGHADGFQSFFPGPGIGNVSHVDGHPGGAYALAVAWASSRLVRFHNGTWTTGSAAPDLGTARLQKLEFNGDGSRAIIVGGYERSTGRAELREFRDRAYSTSEITDISIPGFDQAPYLGVNGTGLFDASWRPSCDEGYLVGGSGGVSSGRGWLIHFTVANGRGCP